jgi:predicted RNA-binding Zn-ribbon protein involved in translation (DUF1610 family)
MSNLKQNLKYACEKCGIYVQLNRKFCCEFCGAKISRSKQFKINNRRL